MLPICAFAQRGDWRMRFADQALPWCND